MIDNHIRSRGAPATPRTLNALNPHQPPPGGERHPQVLLLLLALHRLLDLCGAPDIPVSRGAAQPLACPMRTAEDTHGPAGLGYAELPTSDRRLTEYDSAQAWVRAAHGAGQTLGDKEVIYYRRERKKGLTTSGILYWIVQRLGMAGVPFLGGKALPKVDEADDRISLPTFLEG